MKLNFKAARAISCTIVNILMPVIYLLGTNMRKPEAAAERCSVKKMLLDCPTLFLYSRQTKNVKELRNYNQKLFLCPLQK